MKTVKGTRDFLPEEMILRQQVLDKIKSVFEIYGFQPLETSALEDWKVLSTKGAGSEEILNETYNFEDKGGRRIGLRYDLTVPLARVVASNPNLTLAFKRYQIEKVWRYGDIAKDRFREFLQADIDIVGSDSMLADAEIIKCAISCFKALGLEKIYVRLNNRKILEALVKNAGIEDNKVMSVLGTIDKLEKIGIKNVKKELEEKNISKDSTMKILEPIKIKEEPKIVLKKLENMIGRNEGIQELKEIISYLKDESKIKIDLSLARGLDYYTGPIYEVLAEEGIGSVAGGGRYDKLIGLFLKRDIPATGISFGIDRIIEVMKQRKMVKSETKIKVFVASVNDKIRDKVLEIVQLLRDKSIACDYDFRSRSLSKQLEYVSNMKIPYAIIVGKKELKENSVKLRNMRTGKEELVKINDIIKKF